MKSKKSKVAVLFSGGKDSVMALRWAMKSHPVETLISLKPEQEDSFMFHVPNVGFVEYQAEALSLPLIFKRTEGIKEEELLDLQKAIEKAVQSYDIEGVVAGALASNYQKKRLERICEELHLDSYTPYWQFDEDKYMQEIIDSGFEVVFTGVSAEGLDESWLGRKLTEDALDDLRRLNKKHGVHLAGEGGEYETFVLDGPIFERKISVKKAEKDWQGDSGKVRFKEAELS